MSPGLQGQSLPCIASIFHLPILNTISLATPSGFRRFGVSQSAPQLWAETPSGVSGATQEFYPLPHQ